MSKIASEMWSRDMALGVATWAGLALLAGCGAPGAPRPVDWPVCERGMVLCAPNADELSVASCDPETGLVGSCIAPRHQIHEGEPCELVPGATWQRVFDPALGEPPDGAVPGVACLPPGPFETSLDVYLALPQREREDFDRMMRCGTGAVVTVAEGCPTDASIVPRDDAPAVPHENGCTPLTCESAQRDCGVGLDGCGHYLDCGECTTFSEIEYSERVFLAAASPRRGMIYVVPGGSTSQRLLALSRDDLSQRGALDLPFLIAGLVADDAGGRLYVRFVPSNVDTIGLGVVDLDDWTFRMLDLGGPIVAPETGPANLEALGVTPVAGVQDRIAVYVGLPSSRTPTRLGHPIGLALYDPVSGTRIFMPEDSFSAPAIRSLFAGEPGVVYAGLAGPLFLRRYELTGDVVDDFEDTSPNRQLELYDWRFRDAHYFGGFILDSAGVLLSADGEEQDLLMFHGEETGFAPDPDGDRFYAATPQGVQAFDTATHRTIAVMEGEAGRQLLWLGDRRLGIVTTRSVGGDYDYLSVIRSDGIAP